jgi:trans-2,3-dihydro-3-hydroxyanthranilate isomerase
MAHGAIRTLTIGGKLNTVRLYFATGAVYRRFSKECVDTCAMAVTPLCYRLLNVFTCQGDALSGNPLCVFENGAGVTPATMQILARQFNLSETTFILPAAAPSADAQVRIFTPGYEMPFAGHPTLGTAHVCRSLGLGGDCVRLEMKAGVIPVCAAADRWTLAANAPVWRELQTPERLAPLLGLAASDIALRAMWVDTGTEQLIVPLTSAEAVRRAAPRADIFHQLLSEPGRGAVYVFAHSAPERILARFFFAADGGAVREDPATGSATANLGGWWLATESPLPARLTCSQGEQILRPSTLFLQVDQARQIRVGGDVVEIGRGTINLPDA